MKDIRINKDIVNLITKSVLAGVLIALAGIVYLNCSDKVVGSFLFSFGLYAVLELNAKLFTGVIGNVSSKRDVLDSIIILVVNCTTAVIIGIVYRFTFGENQVFQNIVTQQSIWKVLVESIVCGGLIYIACTVYRKVNNPFIIIICVMAFILSGSLHSIACSFYITLGDISWMSILYLFIIIVGNSLGALGLRVLKTSVNK